MPFWHLFLIQNFPKEWCDLFQRQILDTLIMTKSHIVFYISAGTLTFFINKGRSNNRKFPAEESFKQVLSLSYCNSFFYRVSEQKNSLFLFHLLFSALDCHLVDSKRFQYHLCWNKWFNLLKQKHVLPCENKFLPACKRQCSKLLCETHFKSADHLKYCIYLFLSWELISGTIMLKDRIQNWTQPILSINYKKEWFLFQWNKAANRIM